jgi:hypothetical protein
MKAFDLDVPKEQYWLVKDLCTIIYNIEKRKYPKYTDKGYFLLLKKRIKKMYTDYNGKKTVIELLREYRRTLDKKEGY